MVTICLLKILKLYLSSLLGAIQPEKNLVEKKITHIVSIVDDNFPRHKSMEYLVLELEDNPKTDLKQHFEKINNFIGSFVSC